jgi:cellulose synthase operon protein C
VFRWTLPLVLTGCLVTANAGAFVWPSTVERAARDLNSPDVAARRKAAKQLAGFPRPSVARLGGPALSDPDPDVRVATLEALVAARAEGLGERVVAWLADPEARVRRAAAEALVRQPTASAVAPLSRALGDPDAAVRAAAARALGSSVAPAAVVALLGRLDDNDADVRGAVASALARIGDRAAVVPLIGKIQDTRPNVRRSVAFALGALGDSRASSALSLLLRDSDDTVRIAALRALGTLASADAALAVISLLEDERRPQVREAALQALAQMPSDAGIDALMRALSGDDPREKSPVRAALARTGARAVTRLKSCLAGQPTFNLGDGCALVLGEIRAEGAVDAISQALRRGVVRPRAALAALAACGDHRALAIVVEYLAVDDPWVRRAAVEATQALLDQTDPDGRAVEPILRALDAAHGRKAERVALVSLLGKTGSPRAAPMLAALALDKADPALRLSAIEALGLVEHTAQEEVLVRALSDEYTAIRLAAALALRHRATQGTANVLLDRYERAAEQDRRALLIALGGPLSVTTDAAVVSRVERLVVSSDGEDRDRLIEALGRVRGKLGSAALVRLFESGVDAPTRSKVAEALATHPEALAIIERLSADPDPSVRANAVWAMGSVAPAGDVATLQARLSDSDPSVAGNAAAAMGRLGLRGAAVATPLCAALKNPFPYARANALASLAVLAVRCDAESARSLLASDPAEVVRVAAARLISRVPAADRDKDRLALGRCAESEPSGDVAAACVADAAPLPTRIADVSVYVVPTGASAPVPSSPFALLRADGLARLGVTDRAGSVYEHDAPRGTVRLGVPAALVF